MSDKLLPVYRVVNGELVRKEGDVRDPARRYAGMTGPEGECLREFTDDEERQRDAEEAEWAAAAPQREAEARRREAEDAAFRESLKYENRFVVFIDVLGWTEAVRRSSLDADSTKALGLALNAIKVYAEFIGGMRNSGDPNRWPGEPRVSHFSDCLIMSVTPDGTGLYHLISALGLLSISFLYQGFVIRGGLTAGAIYHRDSTVFGPALLRAYELEKQYAKYPRVVVDPELPWGQGDRYLEDGREIGRARTWRLAADGLWFFDFLQPLGGAPDFRDSPHLIRANLEPLRAVLLNALGTYNERPGVRSKYVWLARYFNDVCAEYSAHGVDPIAENDLT